MLHLLFLVSQADEVVLLRIFRKDARGRVLLLISGFVDFFLLSQIDGVLGGDVGIKDITFEDGVFLLLLVLKVLQVF